MKELLEIYNATSLSHTSTCNSIKELIVSPIKVLDENELELLEVFSKFNFYKQEAIIKKLKEM